MEIKKKKKLLGKGWSSTEIYTETPDIKVGIAQRPNFNKTQLKKWKENSSYLLIRGQ